MTPERWQRIRLILEAALAKAPDSLPAFLDSACAGDPTLRQEVEDLLSTRDASGTLGVEPLTPGRTFGSYRIEHLIGRGGMGEVYLATDMRLGRPVALKVLPSRLTHDRNRLQRFRLEARAASALNHPNILTIYEVGETDGIHYIASELVEGETLRDRIRQGPVSATVAIEIMLQVASALEAAHAAGVIHRDIKPENIMLRRDEYVKVLDFGLAKLAEPTLDTLELTEIKTQSGAIVGTPHYLSPEQARGQTLDERTDMWSFGVVLYELIAGHHPFEGPSINDVVANILHHDPPPLRAPEELQAVTRRALEKDPDQRYPAMAEIIKDMKPLAGGRSANAAPRKWPVGLIAVILALTALIFMFGRLARMRPPDPAIPQLRSVAVLPFVNMSGAPENDYISDGMTEEIINALAQLPELKVVSRTSVFALKDQPNDLQTLADKLNVGAVVEGSVQRSGSRLRVSAKLVDVGNGYNLWSDRFDRELIDIFAIQDEIAAAVAGALQAQIGAGKSLVSAPTQDLRAYELYLKGRQAAGIWTRPSFDRAINFYQAALARDPEFAEVWAGLAEVYSMLDHRPGLTTLPPVESYRLAMDAADRALQLRPDSAEAHGAKGHILMHLGDFQGALRHLERALQINPNASSPRLWYGNVLKTLQRYPEARTAYQHARSIDPLSNLVHHVASTNFWNMGMFEEAIAASRSGLEASPEFGDLHIHLARSYAALGMADAALQALDRAASAEERPTLLEEERATVLAMSGRTEEARALLRRIESEKAQPGAVAMMRAYAAVGDVDAAVRWLQRFADETPMYARGGSLDLPDHPSFRPLRNDPRFLQVRRELGLPVPLANFPSDTAASR